MAPPGTGQPSSTACKKPPTSWLVSTRGSANWRRPTSLGSGAASPCHSHAAASERTGPTPLNRWPAPPSAQLTPSRWAQRCRAPRRDGALAPTPGRKVSFGVTLEPDLHGIGTSGFHARQVSHRERTLLRATREDSLCADHVVQAGRL